MGKEKRIKKYQNDELLELVKKDLDIEVKLSSFKLKKLFGKIDDGFTELEKKKLIKKAIKNDGITFEEFLEIYDEKTTKLRVTIRKKFIDEFGVELWEIIDGIDEDKDGKISWKELIKYKDIFGYTQSEVKKLFQDPKTGELKKLSYEQILINSVGEAENEELLRNYYKDSINCDSCSKNVTHGIWHHCLTCGDYDYCNNCFLNMTVDKMHHLHQWATIEKPTEKMLQKLRYDAKARIMKKYSGLQFPFKIFEKYFDETLSKGETKLEILGFYELLEKTGSVSFISEKKLKEMFQQYDKNGDGYIDFEEYIEALIKITLQRAFNEYFLNDEKTKREKEEERKDEIAEIKKGNKKCTVCKRSFCASQVISQVAIFDGLKVFCGSRAANRFYCCNCENYVSSLIDDLE